MGVNEDILGVLDQSVRLLIDDLMSNINVTQDACSMQMNRTPENLKRQL
jgi:hypothetical protein